MPVSGKESILNGIFRVWRVPQEPQSPLVKHGQVSGDDAVQFLGTLAKDPAANCWLFFNERCYRRHKRILSEQPRVSKDYSLPAAGLDTVPDRSHAMTPPEAGIDAGAFAREQNSTTFPGWV